MREFLEFLKRGEFRIPKCMSCNRGVWPPSNRCPNCLSKTAFKKTRTIGILIEFTRSHVAGKEGVFGLVDVSGFRIVGSFGNAHLKEGMKVKMTECGVQSDGTAYYNFEPHA